MYDDIAEVIKAAEEFWQRLQEADDYHKWMAISYLLEQWAQLKLHRSGKRDEGVV